MFLISIKHQIEAYLPQVQCGLSCHIEREMSGSNEKKIKTKKENEEEMPGKLHLVAGGKLLKHTIMRENTVGEQYLQAF